MTKITKSQEQKAKVKFDDAFEKSLVEKDARLHREAIETMLAEIELDEVYHELLEVEGRVDDFFLSWDKAYKSEPRNSPEREGLRELGKKSKKYYNKRKYKKLHTLFFDLTFNNLLKYIDIENHKDFDELTDVDLFGKSLIPSEIFLQIFLLDAPVKMKRFDWHRSEEVMQQHLNLLILLFDDVFVFFHDSEEL